MLPMQYQDFVPMSYQPDFSTSDLLLETGKRSKERHHGSPMKSKLPLSPKSTIATKHQSQIYGVPLLETQLIPSLRDTINRMTRPPNVAKSCSPGPARDDKKEDSLKTNLRLPNFQSNSPLPPNAISVKAVEMTESQSRLAAKTLKSVLRSPKAPKTPAGAASPPSQNSPALRSMRSILGKKMKAPPPSSSKPRGISSKDVFVCSSDKLQLNSRSRSCTDPGQPLDSFSREHQSTFHYATSSEDRDSITQPAPTTKSRNKIPKSSIPRPANIRRRAQTAHSEPVTEDSDIELRYEVENRDRRRLTVANAEVYPSSSSASVLGSSTESVHHVPQSPVTPKQYSTLRRETKWSYQGLGLALDSQRDPPDKEPPTTPAGPNSNVETDSGLRSFSHKLPQSNFVLENARRRAALLKLVAKLDSEQETVSGCDHQVDNDESDCAVEEGVALSGSSISVVNRNCFPDKDDDEASQYEDDYEVDDMYQPHLSAALTDMQSNAFDNNLVRQQWNQSHGMALRGKSPSRSPVIRQSICEGSPALIPPPVLKRRSIYIEVPDVILQNSASLKPGNGASPSENQADVDTASLVSDTANVIAARARHAFGIPQSESDKLYDNPELRLSRASLAESQFSSAGSDFWRATCEDDNSGGVNELSDGAASLFRNLSGGKGREEQRDSACSGRRRGSSASSAPAQHWDTVKRHELSPASADPASGSPCPRSLYDSGHHSVHQVDDSNDNPTETRRQKVIREFCESEETFVARLHVCVQLFILPLRIRNSKSWVDGVPSDIAHFLDWFEDIANLHSRHIVDTLRNVQRNVAHPEQNVVRCIAEPLLTLIPRLEIYQPYLVRLGTVANAVGRMVREGDNDFGEFVAIQQRAPECGGWGLEEFLLEPMNRLTKYCDIFSRLLSCTPKDHSDYLPTFSLLQSIDVIVRVMTEVKVREDEYDFIKDLASNIRGFPPNLQLASRDRRLLCQTQLALAPEGDQGDLSTPKAVNQELRTPTKPTLKERAGNRMSRLASAVQAWDAIRGRSGSIKSTTSSCAGLSIRSDVSRDFSKGEHITSYGTPAALEPRKIIHLFILSDLVILATPISQDSDKPAFQLVNGIGLSQVFHADLQDEDGCSESIAVVLDLIPLNEELKMSTMSLTTVRARLLLQSETQGQGEKRLSAQRQIEQWRSAFQRSSQSTLRSLSYPTVSDKMNYTKCQDPNHLMTPLLNAGLPVPKSPSIQVLDVKNGQMGDSMQHEREERGWWSLRFQQILQEMYKS